MIVASSGSSSPQSGSARLTAARRHLLSAVTPLLEPLELDGVLVTFDALHSVQANVTWLVETKKAHYISVIKALSA